MICVFWIRYEHATSKQYITCCVTKHNGPWMFLMCSFQFFIVCFVGTLFDHIRDWSGVKPARALQICFFLTLIHWLTHSYPNPKCTFVCWYDCWFDLLIILFKSFGERCTFVGPRCGYLLITYADWSWPCSVVYYIELVSISLQRHSAFQVP